eukprot:TRINITY_DN2991_c0_g1_i2.p2 TRINITY_DN2991_c0_g1~~TRINITY_DN2991_c0_g1_i2.p2  ORF type:complete len:396 (-),score=90.18 TRINITY_DN2991_c0_g1_i2:1104-2291(-)
MLRGLGLKSNYVILMVMIEAAIFSIPAMLVAFVIAYMLNITVSLAIFHKTYMATSYFLHPIGFAYGLVIGVVMPLLSNILPIRRALSKSLRDGLNLARKTINDVTVRIAKLSQMGISFTQLIVALTLIACGLIAYYFVPLSIYYGNYELLMLELNMIFLAMILGMIFLSTFLVPYIERGVVALSLLIVCKDRKLKPVILSNLKGHTKRNTKTSLMYSIALAFLIMTGSSIAQVKQLFLSVTKLGLASDLMLYSPPGVTPGLDELKIRNYLTDFKRYRGIVRDFTFITKDLDAVTYTSSQRNYFGPFGGYPTLPVNTYAVEENYLLAIDADYYYPIAFDETAEVRYLPDGRQDAVKAIYSNAGIHNEFDEFDRGEIIVSDEKLKNISYPRNTETHS